MDDIFIKDIEQIGLIVQNTLHNNKSFYLMAVAGSSMFSLYNYLQLMQGKIVGVDINQEKISELQGTMYTKHEKSNITNDIGCVILSHTFIKGNFEDLEECKKKKIPLILRSDFFRWIFYSLKKEKPSRKIILVLGSDGKTSTSGFLWKLLRQLNKDPSIFSGCYLESIGANHYIGDGDIIFESDESTDDHARIESDILFLTSLYTDHLDAYDYDFKKLEQSFIEATNNSKYVIYYPSDTLNSVILKSNKTIGVNAFSYSDENLESDCYLKKYSETALGSTMDLVIKKNNTIFNFKVTVPFIGVKNMLNYSAVVFYSIDENNIRKSIMKIIDYSRFIFLAPERDTFCGVINNIYIVNNFAVSTESFICILNAYNNIYPDKKIFIVMELVRYERYNMIVDSFVEFIDRVEKIIVTPVLSYHDGRYMKSNELKPNNLNPEKFFLYDTMEEVNREIDKILEKESGILLCIGFNKPYGLRIMNRQISF